MKTNKSYPQERTRLKDIDFDWLEANSETEQIEDAKNLFTLGVLDLPLPENIITPDLN